MFVVLCHTLSLVTWGVKVFRKRSKKSKTLKSTKEILICYVFGTSLILVSIWMCGVYNIMHELVFITWEHVRASILVESLLFKIWYLICISIAREKLEVS